MNADSAEDRELLAALRRVVRDHGGEAVAEELVLAEPVLDRYRIVRRLGAGGMGIVYEAEQRTPRRRVALKVLRPGALSDRALRRFEYEAEILGRLDHPGIAKVVEAGSYDAGQGPQPWFAMELVSGETLSHWLTSSGSDRRARLELFCAICDAVQHAHQKGVIHRDLKPANILIDSGTRPKVVDFGVARSIGADAAEFTTRIGQIVGTLPYASPEQLEGNPETVDVRSDVYALGVILYEMLAGRVPLELSGKSITEAARAIEAIDPPRLGTLEPELRGDLDAIAAKALEKDRERRYPSAAALAEDVRRYLSHEPILARPPTRLYQLSRFARRNRALVGGMAAVFVALLAGIVATWLQAERATRAERDTRKALDQASTDARRAKAASGFLQSVIEHADPAQPLAPDPSMRQVLEAASERVARELANDPAVEAAVRASIGRAYLGLGDHERSRANLERSLELDDRALGADSAESMAVRVALAELARVQGRYAEVEAHVAHLLESASHGGERSIELAAGLESLGSAHYERARYEPAEATLREAIRLLAGRPADTGRVRQTLALVLTARGDLAGAEAELRTAVGELRESWGPRSPFTASALDLLAGTLVRAGRYADAQPFALEAVEIRRERYDGDHTAIAASLQTLGLIAQATRDLEAAIGHYREALELTEIALGARHVRAAQLHLLLGQALLEHGSIADAERELHGAIEAFDEGPTRDHAIVAGALRLLAPLHKRAGCPSEAEAAAVESLAIHSRVYPPEHEKVLDARATLGWVLIDQMRFEESESHLIAAYHGVLAAHGDTHHSIAELRRKLTLLYEAWGKPDLAREFSQP